MALTHAQVDQLLQPINPRRVLSDERGLSHVAQQDVRAHLTRIFGFSGWDKEIIDLTCIRDTMKTVPARQGKPERVVPDVTYLCRMRLTVRDPDGTVIKVTEDVASGTAPNLPEHGDAHDFASKVAVSMALKRCATDLGDQFGLSLYNKGQLSALVVDTLVKPEGAAAPATGDIQAEVPTQVDMGNEYTADPVATGTAALTAAGMYTPPKALPAVPPNGDAMLAVKQKIAQLANGDLTWLRTDFGDWTSTTANPEHGEDISLASMELLQEYAGVLPDRLARR